VGIARALVSLVAKAVHGLVSIPVPVLVYVAVSISIIQAVVVAAVVQIWAVGVGGALCVAATGWIGAAVSAHGAVVGVRGGGD
jgi:hypothetical protein